MVLTNVPTVDDLAEATGQSKEQLRKDWEAIAKMSYEPEDE